MDWLDNNARIKNGNMDVFFLNDFMRDIHGLNRSFYAMLYDIWFPFGIWLRHICFLEMGWIWPHNKCCVWTFHVISYHVMSCHFTWGFFGGSAVDINIAININLSKCTYMMGYFECHERLNRSESITQFRIILV